MFSVAIGMDRSEDYLDETRRRDIEVALHREKIQYGWTQAYLECRFSLENCNLQPDWFLNTVRKIMYTTGKVQCLAYINVTSPGLIEKDLLALAGRVRVFTFHLGANATVLKLQPLDLTKGLEHTLRAFQVIAVQFMAQMAIKVRIAQIADLIEKRHDYAAAVGKLRDLPGYMPFATCPLKTQWEQMME